MTRINVYTEGDEYESGTLAGWFDPSKADHWDDSDYNGNGSLGTGRGTGLYRTAQGRWVSDVWSRWQGEPSHACTFTTPEQAREWLLRNDEDAAVAKHFGEIKEERGPGRPEVGGAVHVRLGDLVERVDAYASEHGITRADAIRVLLAEALNAAWPYAVTVLDYQTRVREVSSRHASLAAAVEALRDEEAYDAEDNGLPSRYPRVEHDGRPVDTEAVSG